MHHLILIRETDQQGSGSTCCGLSGDVAKWDESGAIFSERRERMLRIGEIYRAVRAAFPTEVEITVVDPRNFVSVAGILARDAIRFHLPLSEILRTLGSTSLATGIFDGEVLFSGVPSPPDDVVAAIAVRLELERIALDSAAGAGDSPGPGDSFAPEK
jgi:hypothetical protein